MVNLKIYDFNSCTEHQAIFVYDEDDIKSSIVVVRYLNKPGWVVGECKLASCQSLDQRESLTSRSLPSSFLHSIVLYIENLELRLHACVSPMYRAIIDPSETWNRRNIIHCE